MTKYHVVTMSTLLQPQEYDSKLVVSKLISIWYPLCRDYGDFLSIKSDTNIPIIRYVEHCKLRCCLGFQELIQLSVR